MSMQDFKNNTNIFLLNIVNRHTESPEFSNQVLHSCGNYSSYNQYHSFPDRFSIFIICVLIIFQTLYPTHPFRPLVNDSVNSMITSSERDDDDDD